MATSRTTSRPAPAAGLALTWWAASGFALGIAALLALVVVASATPVDAEVARTGAGSLGLRYFGGEIGLRSAGVLIFVLAAVVLFAQSAKHSRMLEAQEHQRQLQRKQNGSRSRE